MPINNGTIDEHSEYQIGY